MATKKKANKAPTLALLSTMITEKGFAKQLSFAESIGMTRTEFSPLLHGKRVPTEDEIIKIKEALKGVKNLDVNIKKWISGVKISIGRRNGTKKKKATKKSALKKSATVKPAVVKTLAPKKEAKKAEIKKKEPVPPKLSEVLEKLNEIPGITDELILHVMHFYKK